VFTISRLAIIPAKPTASMNRNADSRSTKFISVAVLQKQGSCQSSQQDQYGSIQLLSWTIFRLTIKSGSFTFLHYCLFTYPLFLFCILQTKEPQTLHRTVITSPLSENTHPPHPEITNMQFFNSKLHICSILESIIQVSTSHNILIYHTMYHRTFVGTDHALSLNQRGLHPG
jgi:hypothetical protein